MWLNKKYNYINGFQLEFTIEDISSNFEGFAVVLQQMGPESAGDNGSGLGYSGIQNSLAIEFDSKYSYDKNDPTTPNGRHLSVIVDK